MTIIFLMIWERKELFLSHKILNVIILLYILKQMKKKKLNWNRNILIFTWIWKHDLWLLGTEKKNPFADTYRYQARDVFPLMKIWIEKLFPSALYSKQPFHGIFVFFKLKVLTN